jgi:tRNA(Ile)-lysidine synthase
VTLAERVARTIASRGLWAAGDRVVVAVSGGLDSIALLDLLVAGRQAHGAALEVATVDHGTRESSAADAAFVAGIADGYGLRCTRLAVSPESASEAELRRVRYAALFGLDADVIATAHHADDQLETVLINLLRGTGGRGLAGMPWRRDRLARPLLDVRRAELRGWAVARGLRWVEDPTNADPRYLRNRVRAELVPLLEALRTGAGDAILRSAALAAEDEALLDAALAADPGGTPIDGAWSTPWLRDAPLPLVRRALRRALPAATAVHADAIRAAATRGAGAVGIPGGGRVVIEAGRSAIIPGSTGNSDQDPSEGG